MFWVSWGLVLIVFQGGATGWLPWGFLFGLSGLLVAVQLPIAIPSALLEDDVEAYLQWRRSRAVGLTGLLVVRGCWSHVAVGLTGLLVARGCWSHVAVGLAGLVLVCWGSFFVLLRGPRRQSR